MGTVGDFGVGTKHSGFRAIRHSDGEFNYNQEVEVEDSQTAYRDFWIRSMSGTANQLGPIMFTLEPSKDWYAMLHTARLETTFHLVKGDGSKCNELTDVVAPVNLLGAVMFESVEPTLNGHPMSGASCVNCGLKAFIDAMLSYDKDAAESHMLTQFLHMDTPGHYDNMLLAIPTMKRIFRDLVKKHEIQLGVPIPDNCKDLPADVVKPDGSPYTPFEREKENGVRMVRQNKFVDEHFYRAMGISPERQQAMLTGDMMNQGINKGFETRSRLVAGSREVTLFSPIPHDLFNMNNHLGPMNRLDIKLTMYPPRFLLNTYMHFKGYKIVIDDMKLHMRAVKRKENIPIPLKEIYRMNETHLMKHVVPAGLFTYSFRMLNTGILPKTIILGTISTSAVEGNYGSNPFNFHHFNLRKVSLSVNGEERPSGGMEYDFERPSANTARGYHSLFANTGALAGSRGNLVSLPHFQAGCFLQAFDLNPDLCNGAHLHNGEYGYIDVNFVWAHELAHPITIVYEFVYNRVLVNEKTHGTVTVLDVAV